MTRRKEYNPLDMLPTADVVRRKVAEAELNLSRLRALLQAVETVERAGLKATEDKGDER